MGLFKKTPPPPPPPPPSSAARRAKKQYDHDVEIWRQQNKVTVQDQRAAAELLAQSERARDCGNRREAQRLAREAYAKSDAANQARVAAETRMNDSRRNWQHHRG